MMPRPFWPPSMDVVLKIMKSSGDAAGLRQPKPILLTGLCCTCSPLPGSFIVDYMPTLRNLKFLRRVFVWWFSSMLSFRPTRKGQAASYVKGKSRWNFSQPNMQQFHKSKNSRDNFFHSDQGTSSVGIRVVFRTLWVAVNIVDLIPITRWSHS